MFMDAEDKQNVIAYGSVCWWRRIKHTVYERRRAKMSNLWLVGIPIAIETEHFSDFVQFFFLLNIVLLNAR